MRLSQFMDSLRHRLGRSIAQRGVFGTIPMCWWTLCSYIRPSARQEKKLREQIDDTFDREHGVDTRGVVRPEPESVIGENWAHGVTYQAVEPAAFSETLARLPIAHPDFTFIDFGAGKGRALLLAAQYPFRKIIGVEYCLELANVAARNLNAASKSVRCDHIEVAVADAAEFPIPPEPLVLFFFNPFGKAVMQRVAQNVAGSLETNPRPVFIIYFTPYFADLWEVTGRFHRLQDSPAILTTERELKLR
jgi:hypothetical protein